MPGRAVARFVLLFDGTCALCSGWARFLAEKDHRDRFRLVANGTAEGKALLDRHGVADVADDTVVLLGNGRVHLRSAAVVRILWGLGGAWTVLGVLLWLVPRPLRDAGYRAVARRRHRRAAP